MERDRLAKELHHLARDAHYLAIHLNGAMAAEEVDDAHETCSVLAAQLTELGRQLESRGTEN